SPTLVLADGETSEGINKMKLPQMPVTMSIVQQSGTYAAFEDLDLTGVSAVAFAALAPIQYLNSAGGTIEVRLDAPDGPLVGRTEPLRPDTMMGMPSRLQAPLDPTTGRHDVYFVFRNDEAPPDRNLFVALTATFVSATAPQE